MAIVCAENSFDGRFRRSGGEVPLLGFCCNEINKRGALCRTGEEIPTGG
jgi:hypothetical protein